MGWESLGRAVGTNSPPPNLTRPITLLKIFATRTINTNQITNKQRSLDSS